ncbi:type VI secretion system lipoprotein TssJ [Mesorhizobium opportunistum]|jgi:type VI secretion system protein VasD|uniref:Type VI secretion system lipoprotein TssJ n=1 Tax=Mesorhizobium opportunistum TaxID=593909 RepID=A0ABV1YKL5_9HYPH|nr:MULTISPECIES: type VI secretion system lipoprotein TssJ [Mesorhizobium]TIN91046.1 MAG: type VI secretion system lipoprotein TssJ [Mesorhizobium sp.]TJU96187.1 MAG: type VI secretion system lipoprotein TssJ [Mesorhizobium sp.]TJV15482.1 MAG: type VI secretion system lipoprotein TssJ [Mesorhizobium sp.]TJV41233.1 MAG: type VI secretion system lipoprotein TssJ [Mesorhizobium sp.]WJI38907.1 type VI secretion system lipoprotein TssJ [Mesorhizobium opportunistum]
MIDRRQFVVTLGATGLLAACQSGPPKPSVITVNVSGGAGMNPGPGGGDRPVTVLVMRLRSTGKFNSADYFALQGDAGSALAGDLIGSDQIAVGPGKSASKTITVEPDAAALGFVALIREPTGRNWRTTKSVSPGSKFTINVSLGSGGISA